jgi:hypothetical protein
MSKFNAAAAARQQQQQHQLQVTQPGLLQQQPQIPLFGTPAESYVAPAAVPPPIKSVLKKTSKTSSFKDDTFVPGFAPLSVDDTPTIAGAISLLGPQTGFGRDAVPTPSLSGPCGIPGGRTETT